MGPLLFLEAEHACFSFQNESLQAERVQATRFLDNTALVMRAVHAELQDQTLKLQGEALLTHPLGTFGANEMILYAAEGAAKPDRLSMEGAVEIELKGQGALHAAHADLYFDQQPKLLNSSVGVERMVAEGGVWMKYGAQFTLAGERATFQKAAQAEAPPHQIVPITGEIQIEAAKGGYCKIDHSGGSTIWATHIALDMGRGQLQLHDPRGKLKLAACGAQEKAEDAEVDFQAGRLLWDDLTSVLTLQNQIRIDQTGIGAIETDKEMRIYQRQIEGRRVFYKMEADGTSSISYQDPEHRLSHTLVCHGRVTIDHEKMETRLYSPVEQNGQQVCFKDPCCEMFADKVLIKYAYQGRKAIPTQISLYGNAKIYSRYAHPQDPQRAVSQYALADRVDLLLETQQMHFKAGKGKRVLFYDQENDIEVSAPGIIATRGKTSGKESIQGVGDVRFRFAAEEYDRLREQFSATVWQAKSALPAKKERASQNGEAEAK